MPSIKQNLTKQLPWIAAAGLVGAAVFAGAQELAGFSTNIAEFMGREIVRRGGYDPSLATPIGWTVHIAVALSYASLFGLITTLRVFQGRRLVRWAGTAAVAFVFGWIATLLTAPAISTTISLLAGEGFPAALPGLNTTFGFAFWNHVGFFAVGFVFNVLARDWLGARTRMIAADTGNHPAAATSGVSA